MADKHALEIRGYNELLAEFCELSDRVTAIEALISRLHLSEMVTELKALGCEVSVRIAVPRPAAEVVTDLGHGWQIIREKTDGD